MTSRAIHYIQPPASPDSVMDDPADGVYEDDSCGEILLSPASLNYLPCSGMYDPADDVYVGDDWALSLPDGETPDSEIEDPVNGVDVGVPEPTASETDDEDVYIDVVGDGDETIEGLAPQNKDEQRDRDKEIKLKFIEYSDSSDSSDSVEVIENIPLVTDDSETDDALDIIGDGTKRGQKENNGNVHNIQDIIDHEIIPQYSPRCVESQYVPHIMDIDLDRNTTEWLRASDVLPTADSQQQVSRPVIISSSSDNEEAPQRRSRKRPAEETSETSETETVTTNQKRMKSDREKHLSIDVTLSVPCSSGTVISMHMELTADDGTSNNPIPSTSRELPTNSPPRDPCIQEAPQEFRATFGEILDISARISINETLNSEQGRGANQGGRDLQRAQSDSSSRSSSPDPNSKSSSD